VLTILRSGVSHCESVGFAYSQPSRRIGGGRWWGERRSVKSLALVVVLGAGGDFLLRGELGKSKRKGGGEEGEKKRYCRKKVRKGDFLGKCRMSRGISEKTDK